MEFIQWIFNCSRLSWREGVKRNVFGFVTPVGLHLTPGAVTVASAAACTRKSITSTIDFTWSQVSHAWSCVPYLPLTLRVQSHLPAVGGGLCFQATVKRCTCGVGSCRLAGMGGDGNRKRSPHPCSGCTVSEQRAQS